MLRYFDRFLSHPPLLPKLKVPLKVYLKVDGKYFGHWGCVLVFKADKGIVLWDFVLRENYFNYVYNLSHLRELGYEVQGITSDWHGSLVGAVKSAWPNIPHQRCLVHTWQLCRGLLTRNPETGAGRNLLELVNLLNGIKTHSEKDIWLRWLNRFEERYGDLIKQRTYAEDKRSWWYTHKNLRRAFRTLQSSQAHLFLYLDDPHLSKDTNGLESEFSHLQQKLGVHRGLKRERVVNFVRWYFSLKSIYFRRPKLL